jgi:hypothetical protein
MRAGIVFLGVLTLPLLSLLPAREPASDSGGRAAALAPFIGDESFAVVRFDATKIDADAAIRQLKEAVPDVEERIGEAASAFKMALSEFKAAGGTEIIAVFSTTDLPGLSVVCVPFKEGADESALKEVLTRYTFNRGWRIEKKDRAFITGDSPALARFIRAKPSARPELTAALQAAGDGWLQALLLPTEDQRRVIEEVPLLTRGFSSLPSKTLARGIRWAALGLDAAPKPLLRLTVQSSDATSAKTIASILRNGLTAVGAQILPGEKKPLSELMPAELAAVTSTLTPTVNGDQVTLTLPDTSGLKNVAAVFVFSAERFDRVYSPTAGQNIKQIILALHNYANSIKNYSLPPSAIRSKDGKPLLSWRVAILPYLEQQELYRQFHLDEPWDSEHNKKLIEKMPAVYRSPRIKDRRIGLTTYLVPVGKEVAFTGDAKGRSLRDEFTDGTSNTILLVDVADATGVIWTKPEDLVVDMADPLKGIMGHYPAYFLVGMADGSVRPVPKTVSNATLRSAFTVAGGEVLGPDW